MSSYDYSPCSIHFSNQAVDQAPQPHPRVVEDFSDTTPQKDPSVEQVRASASTVSAPTTRKKSCLSTANPRKEVPPHPALRRKTVAFGRTVNVSQTVEGTSRHSRKMASSSATSSPAQRINDENHGEDWRNVMKTELEVMRKEMQEESSKRQEELNNQNINKMQEMMSQFLQQITVPKQPAIEDNNRERERPRQSKPANKISLARETIRKEGIIPAEVLPIIEQRIRSDPLFRQQIDDVLADAECDANRAAYSPPPPLSEVRYTNGPGGNPALMRETLTVERSIRYGNGLSSIDSRHWTTERSNNTGHDEYRPYEADPPFHSTYQKGQSISYYPSEPANNRQNRNGYFVEHYSDQEEDEVVGGGARAGNYHQESAPSETATERERRIREKYARKK